MNRLMVFGYGFLGWWMLLSLNVIVAAVMFVLALIYASPKETSHA